MSPAAFNKKRRSVTKRREIPKKSRLDVDAASDNEESEELQARHKKPKKPGPMKGGTPSPEKKKLVLPMDDVDGSGSESEELEVEKKSRKLVAKAEEDK